MRRPMTAIMYGIAAVACGVVALLAVLAIIGGEPVAGTVGVALFAAGCAGCAFMARRRWSPPPPPPKAPAGSFDYGTVPGAERYSSYPFGLVFPDKRRAALFTTVGSAAFVAVGAGFLLGALLSDGADAVLPLVIGVVAVVTFGVFGALGLRSLLGRGGGIALFPDGVYLRAPAGSGWVRWEDLEGAWEALPTGGGTTGAHVKLLARSAEAFTLTGLNRPLQGINRSRYDMDVGFPAQYLRVAAEVAVAEIRRFQLTPEERHILGDPSIVERVGEKCDLPPQAPPPLPPSVRKELLADLRREADRPGADPGTRAALLAELVEAGEMQEAQERLRIAEHGGDVDARLSVVVALSELGRTEEAEAHLRQAHAQGSMQAAVLLGESHAEAGRTSQAAALYQEAVQAGHPPGMTGMGQLRHAEGNHDEARRWWLAAAERSELVAMHLLAASAAGAGNDDEARHWWSAAAHQGDVLAMIEMGLHLSAHHAPHEAEQWFARAVQTSPGSEAAIAEALERHGEHEAAERWRQR